MVGTYDMLCFVSTHKKQGAQTRAKVRTILPKASPDSNPLHLSILTSLSSVIPPQKATAKEKMPEHVKMPENISYSDSNSSFSSQSFASKISNLASEVHLPPFHP